MAVTKEQRTGIVKKFQRTDLDTGSPEVQVALLTARINEMTVHFQTHKKDKHGVRGLIKAVNRRRKLLDYLKDDSKTKYESLIKELDIRK
jgi:small subunit ribosomal protein S15